MTPFDLDATEGKPLSQCADYRELFGDRSIPADSEIPADEMKEETCPE